MKPSPAQRARERVLKRAEKLLREDAQSTYDSCKGTDAPWVCGGSTCPNCPARRDYLMRIKTANELFALSRKGGRK